ncbi:MAG: ACP S-malonyltransferase, partial [Gemmataceae bacterium]
QSVLSGPTVEIDRAAKLLLEAGLRITRLSVAAAFHSPLVAEAAKPFREALETVAFLPGRQPVYANTTASVYPVGTDEAKTLLAEQLAKPVLFADEIRALAGSGVRTFLEVGPGGVLARLAEATLGTEKGAEFLAVDSSSGRRASMLDLADVLARLVARGHALNLTAWQQSARPRPLTPAAKPGLTVALCGANYVAPRLRREPRTPTPLALLTTPDENRVMAEPNLNPSDPAAIAQALAATQQTLAALQQMQEQTALLHQQFLQSQELAQRTLANLVAQQQAMFLPGMSVGAVALPPPAPLPLPPAPVVAVPKTIPPMDQSRLVPPPVAPMPAPAVVRPTATLPPPPPPLFTPQSTPRVPVVPAAIPVAQGIFTPPPMARPVSVDIAQTLLNV